MFVLYYHQFEIISMKRFLPIILLVAVILLGASARFIGLGKNPAGIVDDEAGTGYDAYSLLSTGRDQWGVLWPLTSFKGFGDYRLPGYTYLTIPSVAVFGLTPLAIRFPAALFGTLTILMVFVLTRELFGPQLKLIPLLSAFFLSISPWHIGMSRIGLEETTSVFFVTAGMWLLLRGRRYPKSIIAGCIVLGLSLFIYTANIVLVPLLLVVTLFLFRNKFTHSRTWVVLGAVCFIIFFASYFIFAGTSTAVVRSRQVNLTNDSGLIDTVNEKQGACVRLFPRGVCRLVFNKYSAYGAKFVSNYFNHFSPNLLSIYGTDTQYSILPGRGLLYQFDFPLLALSLVIIFLAVSPEKLLLVFWLFLSAVPDSITSDGQFGRYFVSYPMWSILIAVGVVGVLSRIKFRKVFLVSIILLFVTALSNFIIEYTTFFPYRYSRFSHFGYEDLIRQIEIHKHSFDRILVSSRINDAKQYIYYLFYTRYDPALYQSGRGIEKVTEADGWIRVKRVDTIDFIPAIPSKLDLMGKDHVLLIGAPSEFYSKIPTVFTVKDVKGDILFQGVDSYVLLGCTPESCPGSIKKP